MLIDWFTVGAQAINFLILVWLMKHFLYQPILDAIDTREKRIASELADAQTRKAEAKTERDEFQKKNEAFDQQRAALLTQATDDVKKEREKMLADARQASDDLRTKRQESLRQEQQNLNDEIITRTSDEVFSITRKLLSDLCVVSLEERFVAVFVQHLRALDDKTKATFADAFKKSASNKSASDPTLHIVLLRSAFDLPEEQRVVIQKALKEIFAVDITLHFETVPALIGGIELITPGQKLAWNVEDYLLSLKKGIDELLKVKDKSEEPSNENTKEKQPDMHNQ